MSYHDLQNKALTAQEAGELISVDPKILLNLIWDHYENMRIRDIFREQLKAANTKLGKIKKVMDS